MAAGRGQQRRQNADTFLHRTSDSSESSADSTSTTKSPDRQHQTGSKMAMTASSISYMKPSRKPSHDLPFRQASSSTTQQQQQSAAASSSSSLADHSQRHRRQHSQGFFEPSLPTASYSTTPATSHLSASQIAAQAAMHVQNTIYSRSGSDVVPLPTALSHHGAMRRPSGQLGQLAVHTSDNSSISSRGNSQTRSTLQIAAHSSTAATAANVAYPKSPVQSPVMQQGEYVASPTIMDKDQKPSKERSRMKLFSKPKSIISAASKDIDKKSVALQSPGRHVPYASSTISRPGNQSMVNLTDASASCASSIYSTANVSTSTLVPSDRMQAPEKEKTRHNFLYRQKNKLKESNEHYSSASSNSRPIDPSAPQPLYSFAPSSPGPATTVNKSKTGLDLRHGGRALREKKREEKAAAGTFIPPLTKAASASDAHSRDHLPAPTNDWGQASSSSIATPFGPVSASSIHQAELAQGLGGFGLPGMTMDDAWPLLKARLLNIFEGEDIRTPIEDFNKLVMAHLQRCVQSQTPAMIIDDLRELLETGFYSLDQMLRRIPDERLVPHLVETWSFVFGTVLPFMQAVFHPLDLEIRGRGQKLSTKEAREFCGSLLVASKMSPAVFTGSTTAGTSPMPTSITRGPQLAALAHVLDVRTIVLLSFRDTIMLPRYETLLHIFSRLSLDNISNAGFPPGPISPAQRPDTRTSISPTSLQDVAGQSFNSQASTLLDSSAAGSLGVRSRATSNTSAMSANSFTSLAGQRPHASSHGSSRDASNSKGAVASAKISKDAPVVPPGLTNLIDSAKVTQTAARMLQCVSVLAGLQTSESAFSGTNMETNVTKGVRPLPDREEDSVAAARRKMESLGKELKLNWLGRSRTGRNRRGLVGTRQIVGVGA